MVAEKYAVRLSSEDQEQLRGLIYSGRHSARVINRARILLKTDEGWSAPRWWRLWTRRSARCSAPNGGTPKRGWRACCTTIPKPTGIASWTIGVKPT